MKNSGRVTIRDIAKIAGVSPATVSNVLNNPKKVSLESRRKVEEVLQQCDFRPNVHARALKSQLTPTFGLIVPTLEEPYYAQIVQGFDDFLKNHDYGFTLFLTQDLWVNEERALQEIVQQRMAGMASIPSSVQETLFFDRLQETSLSWVCIDRVPLDALEHRGNFLSADYQALALFTASLLRAEKHVRRILFLTASRVFFCEQIFYETFLSELDTLASLVIHVDAPLGWTAAFQKFFPILRDNPDVSHVVATNHVHARAIIDASDYLGLATKVYYLGRENWKAVKESRNVVEISRPGLKIGRRAAEMLVQATQSLVDRPRREVTPVYLERFFVQKDSLSIKRPRKSTVSIRVAMLSDPCYDAIQSLIQDFLARSKTKVFLQAFPYEELYQEVMKNPESEFDVFMVDVSWLPECVYANRLYDLTPMISLTSEPFYGFIPGVLESYALVNGRYFAIPFYFGVQLLFYRRDLFEDGRMKTLFYDQYKKELVPPGDWDTYNQVARFFTRQFNPHSPVEYGTTVGALNDTAIMCEFLPRLWSYGGEIFDRTGHPTIASPQGVEALRAYLETFHYAPPPSNWWGKQVEHFANGKAAMMVMFTSNVNLAFHHQSSRVYDRVGIEEVPGRVSVLGGWSLGIHAKSRYVDAAFEFIRWGCSSELAIPFSLLGGCTAHFSVYQSAELVRALPWARLAEKAFAKTKKRAAVPHLGIEVVEQKYLEHVIGCCIQEALHGQTNPKQALQKAQEMMNAFSFHYVRR
ncbi:MAG: extracellular solute-binding protein [Atribacterota bacterium]